MLKLTTSNAMFPSKVKEISCLKKIQKNKRTKQNQVYSTRLFYWSYEKESNFQQLKQKLSHHHTS